MSEHTIDAGRHRFFKTMVLMGSSLALGCGGVVDDSPAAAGAAGENHTSGTGGTGAAMGGSTTSNGGSTSSGGGSGGTGAASGTSGTGNACSPEQWVCEPVPQCDNHEHYGYELPTDCRCDETKPLSRDDCPSGRRVCMVAMLGTDGMPLDEFVPFACTCATDAQSCSAACHAAFPDGDGHDCVSDSSFLPPPEPGDDFLCGCSFVFLR